MTRSIVTRQICDSVNSENARLCKPYTTSVVDREELDDKGPSTLMINIAKEKKKRRRLTGLLFPLALAERDSRLKRSKVRFESTNRTKR